MNVVFSLILLAAALGCIVFLLTRRENARRSQYGPSGLSEFRTDLPLDDCFDRLDQHSPDDEFAYECRRENDGGFLLHLTLHQPTQQPLDTLYTLRLDPGRQTIATRDSSIREAFGYKEPLFSAGNAGQVHAAEAGSPPHKIILPERFSFRAFLLYLLVRPANRQWGPSSSVGQSWRLITAWSRVQVLAGPYKKTPVQVSFWLWTENRIFSQKHLQRRNSCGK